jgi:hypothetical protein
MISLFMNTAAKHDTTEEAYPSRQGFAGDAAACAAVT